MKPVVDEARDIDEQPYDEENKLPCPACGHKYPEGDEGYYSCQEDEGGCGLYIEAPDNKIEELLTLARKGLEKV